MEEEKDFCGVGVTFGESKKVEIRVSDVEILEAERRVSLLCAELPTKNSSVAFSQKHLG